MSTISLESVSSASVGSETFAMSAGGSEAVSRASSSALAVRTNVDTLLASFTSEMSGEQQLRMIIALLILNALLGGDEKGTSSKAGELAGLASAIGQFGQREGFALFSATNIIQIQHQSTLVMTNQAVQTLGEANLGDQGASGSRLDVSG